MKTYLKTASGVFIASMVGWFIYVLLDPPATPAAKVFCSIGAGLAILTWPLTPLMDRLQPPGPGIVWVTAMCFASALFWSLFIVGVIRVLKRCHTELTASPNGGPVAPVGNSGIEDGPP